MNAGHQENKKIADRIWLLAASPFLRAWMRARRVHSLKLQAGETGKGTSDTNR